MSSILKALKKLEQDSPQAAYPRLWVRRNRGASPRLLWLGGLIVLGLLAVAGGTIFVKRHEAIRPLAPEAIGGLSQGLPSSGGGQNRTVPIGVSGNTASDRFKGPAGGPSNVAPDKGLKGAAVAGRTYAGQTGTTEPAPGQKRTAEPGPLNSTADRPVKTMPQRASAANPPQAASDHVRRAQTASPGPARPDAADPRSTTAVREHAPLLPAKLLTNSDLKIQAISWSVNPEDRIAVVNSRIVREGQTIDGFRVKQINIDDMLLTREGLDWTLKFVNN